MRQGKFRKDCHNFDLRKIVNEIILVQQLQAESMHINLTAEFIGFSDDLSYMFCSDSQRIQQVILNLQSNALKFTSSGGSVKIICRRILCVDDLIHEEHAKHFINGESTLLQISVEDTGVGISPRDIKKLFKLFGFLTSTK